MQKINRRQFIEHGIGALTALVLFPTDLFRYATGQPPREMPVTLGNRSVFYPLWEWPGIQASDARARAAKLKKDDLTVLINETVASLNDGHGADACMDNFAAELHELDRCSGHCPADIDDDGANVRRMNRILADNPGMSREAAFFEAVIEGVEAML